MNTDLKWVLSNYGFVCPKNIEVSTSDFIEHIKKTYCCTNGANKYACDVLELTPKNKYRFEYTGMVEVRS
jgi:hypothetical protein